MMCVDIKYQQNMQGIFDTSRLKRQLKTRLIGAIVYSEILAAYDTQVSLFHFYHRDQIQIQRYHRNQIAEINCLRQFTSGVACQHCP